ncbi:hypothetical protein TNCV_2604261 [Trichonephila clavipes]|nr:hypothetical protein TNCV_2604261 [Trichonephila clavipes]
MRNMQNNFLLPNRTAKKSQKNLPAVHVEAVRLAGISTCSNCGVRVFSAAAKLANLFLLSGGELSREVPEKQDRRRVDYDPLDLPKDRRRNNEQTNFRFLRRCELSSR